MKKLLIIVLLIVGCEKTIAPIEGCTDGNAENYNADANTDDGSCNYLSFQFMNPMGSDIWCVDSTYTIEWIGGNSNDNISISLSGKNDVGGWVGEITIANNIPNSSNYEWISKVGAFGTGDKHLYINNWQGTQYSYSEDFRIIHCSVGDFETVTIGQQLWMAENLRVTHYNNGDEILTGYDNDEWKDLSSGAYTIYDDDPSNVHAYGYLYNWFAVDDDRGICPEDWHVPSDDEYKILTDHLAPDGVVSENQGWTNIIAGGMMKQTGTIEDGNGLWNAPNTGATNESGFAAHPGGFRLGGNTGNYINLGSHAYFWSSTAQNSSNAWHRKLNDNNTEINRPYDAKERGYSVRCLKD